MMTSTLARVLLMLCAVCAVAGTACIPPPSNASYGSGDYENQGGGSDPIQTIQDNLDCHNACDRDNLSCMAGCPDGDYSCRGSCQLDDSNCYQSC